MIAMTMQQDSRAYHFFIHYLKHARQLHCCPLKPGEHAQSCKAAHRTLCAMACNVGRIHVASTQSICRPSRCSTSTGLSTECACHRATYGRYDATQASTTPTSLHLWFVLCIRAVQHAYFSMLQRIDLCFIFFLTSLLIFIISLL